MIYGLMCDMDVGWFELASTLGVVLVVLGGMLLLWASVTTIDLYRTPPSVKSVAIGPPIAVFFGLGLVAYGAWLLYPRRPRR